MNDDVDASGEDPKAIVLKQGFNIKHTLLTSSSEPDLTDKRSSGFTSDDSDQYTQSICQDGSNGLPSMGKRTSKGSKNTQNSSPLKPDKSPNSKKRGRRPSRGNGQGQPAAALVDVGKAFLEAPVSARGRGRSPRSSPRSAAKKAFENNIIITPPLTKNISQSQSISLSNSMGTSKMQASPQEKKTIQFKEDLDSEPFKSQGPKHGKLSQSPPSIMKKSQNTTDLTKTLTKMNQMHSEISQTKLPHPKSDPNLAAMTQAEEKKYGAINVGTVSNQSSTDHKFKICQSSLGDPINAENAEMRSGCHREALSDDESCSIHSSSLMSSNSPTYNVPKLAINSRKSVNASSKLISRYRDVHMISEELGHGLRTPSGLVNLKNEFGLRKMQTMTNQKLENKLALPPKRQNSGVSKQSKQSSASRMRELSAQGKSRKNSKYGGKSEKSYLTFAPTNLQDYNLKINPISTEPPQERIQGVANLPAQSKHLYSKESFKEFSSMKSVLKPRMIHLVKQARDDNRLHNSSRCEDDMSEMSKQVSDKISEPMDSESASVYSHVRSNYLETNISFSVEMCLEKDKYHMRENAKEKGMTEQPQPEQIQPARRPPADKRMSCFTVIQDFQQPSQEKEKAHRRSPSNSQLTKKTGLNSFVKKNTLNLKSQPGNDLLIGDPNTIEKASEKVRSKRSDKKKKQKFNSKSSFDIRDEVSMSDDDDKSNLLIEGTFLYYFPNKPYFICHRRKIYGYTQNSFNKLGFDNVIRQLAIWIDEWPWFDRIIIFLIILNSLGLGMLDYKYTNITNDNSKIKIESPFFNRLMDETEFFFTICFTAEMVIKMISKGVVLDKNCYLRDYWNWLDSIVVIGSILAYLPSVSNVTVLRTFRLFKPLRSLRTLPAMQELVVTLLESVWQLTNIFFLLVFAILIFSILGVQIWRGATHYRCRLTEKPVNGIWPISEENFEVCGGLNTCDSGQVCGSLQDPQWAELLEGHEVKLDEYTQEGTYDITNFDNIFKAMISMFQVATLEGWYSLMVMMMNGYSKYVTMIFFVSAIQICHYLLINMTLAVMVCNLRKQKEDEFNDLIDRKVDLQNKIVERKKILQISKKEKKNTCQTYCNIFIRSLIRVSDDTKEPVGRRYNSNFILCIWQLTTSYFYIGAYLAIVITNVVILAIDKHQAQTEEYLEKKNRDCFILVISNMIFNIDIILKMLAFERKVFCEDRLNLIDLFLSLLFTTLFIVDLQKACTFSLAYQDLYYTNKFIFLSALRMLRIIVVARNLKTIRVLLDCIAFTLDSVGNFLVLLFIFLYVFSLLGMQCFAGRLIFDANGNKLDNLTDISQISAANVPRSNFDSIGQSSVTVFQILIGELWNEVFYDCWKGSGYFLASSYFITLIFFGNIMMLNLFLAMILGNFERASLISEVKSEEEKLEQLMPVSHCDVLTQEQHKADLDVSNSKVRSILRPTTNFEGVNENVTPTTSVWKSKYRSNRVRFGAQVKRTLEAQDTKEKIKRGEVDSSYDSQQSLGEVRQRYGDQKLDSSRAMFDRRASFAPYAIDPYYNVPNEDERERGVDFKLDHYHDEPSPELFQTNEQMQGRIRSMSLVSPRTSSPSPDHRRKTRNTFSGGTQRPAIDASTFTAAIANSLAASNNPLDQLLKLPGQKSGTEIEEEIKEEDSQILLQSGLVRPPIRTRPPRPLPRSRQSDLNLTETSAQGLLKNSRRSSGSGSSHLDSNHFDKDLVMRAMNHGKPTGERMRPKLMIQTGDNPVKKAMVNRRTLTFKTHIDEAPTAIPLKERLNSCWTYMKSSSLFLFHKRTAFRKRLILLVTGGIQKPQFKTVDELVDFYCQSVKKPSIKDEPEDTEEDDQKTSESEDSDQSDYGTKTESEKFLEDPNSSFYIDEVLQVQASPHFSFQNLRDQLTTIKMMQESGKYDHIFVGNTLKDKGSFYLDEKHDIKVAFPKWYRIRPHTIFTQVMNTAVIVSSLMLAFDNPFDEPKSLRQQILLVLDIVLTLLFTTEAVIKIIALGFCKSSLSGKNNKSYLHDSNNVLDFVLVIIQISYIFRKYALSPDQQSLAHGLKAMKALRGLRPLRMISRFKGLKVAMNTILNSGQQIFNIVALAVTVIIIFAVFFVQIFKGTFYRCVIDDDPNAALYDDRINTKQDCLDLGYSWDNPPENFDNLGNAILNLVIFITNENWVNVMYRAVDSRGVDLQPKHNENIQNLALFIAYMTVSHVFILNLFVGVIIQRFNSNNEVIQGYKGNKVNTRKWIDVQRLMMQQELQQKWYLPTKRSQRFFAVVSLSKPFEFFIYLTIICNLVVLAMPYAGMSPLYTSILEQSNIAFSVIYNIEAFIKLYGLRGRYFKETWNVLDFFIVCFSDVGMILSAFTDLDLAVMVPVVRALRVARVLKLIRGGEGLKVIVKAFISLSLNMINILGLLILLVFIYAVLGMNIFHTVMYQEHYNESTNFRTFDNSLILLIRCITGEGWDLIMQDLALKDSYNGVECVLGQSIEDWKTDGVKGCGSDYAYAFFFVFVILSQMVFINLFIAFVLQAYSTSYEENYSLITVADYEKLTTLWSEYDPKATGMIDPQDMAFMVHELEGQLGRAEEYQDVMKMIVERSETEAHSKSVLQKNQRYVIKIERDMILPVSILIQTLSEMSLPIYVTENGHKCHFKDVCIQLSKQALLKQGILEQDEFKEAPMMVSEWAANYDSLKEQVQLEDQNSGSFWAGLFIARLIRQMQLRHKYKTKKAECISEFNKRKEYSKMLRRKEEEERMENEIKDLKARTQGNSNLRDINIAMRKKLQAFKQVKFEFETEAEETPEYDLIDLDHYSGKKLKPQRKTKENKYHQLSRQNPHKYRDVHRSTWWKDPRDPDSTANRMQHWIKINDIRYGVEEERERLRRKNQYQKFIASRQSQLELMSNLKSRNSQQTVSSLEEEGTPNGSQMQMPSMDSMSMSLPFNKEEITMTGMGEGLETDRPLIKIERVDDNQSSLSIAGLVKENSMPSLKTNGVSKEDSPKKHLEMSPPTVTKLKEPSPQVKKEQLTQDDTGLLEEQKVQMTNLPFLSFLGQANMSKEMSFNPERSIKTNSRHEANKAMNGQEQELRKSRTLVLRDEKCFLPKISEMTESQRSDTRDPSISSSQRLAFPNKLNTFSLNDTEKDSVSAPTKTSASQKSDSQPPEERNSSAQLSENHKIPAVTTVEETKQEEEKKEQDPPAPTTAKEETPEEENKNEPEIQNSDSALQQIASRHGTAQFLQNKVMGVVKALPKSQFNCMMDDDLSDCTSYRQGSGSDSESRRMSSGEVDNINSQESKDKSKSRKAKKRINSDKNKAVRGSRFSKFQKQEEISDFETSSEERSDSGSSISVPCKDDETSVKSKKEQYISDSSGGEIRSK